MTAHVSQLKLRGSTLAFARLHCHWQSSLTFTGSPDGGRSGFCGQRFWEGRDNVPIDTPTRHPLPSRPIMISVAPSIRLLATATYETVTLWDLESVCLVCTPSTKAAIYRHSRASAYSDYSASTSGVKTVLDADSLRSMH